MVNEKPLCTVEKFKAAVIAVKFVCNSRRGSSACTFYQLFSMLLNYTQTHRD